MPKQHLSQSVSCMKKLYVASLPYSVGDEELAQFFSQVGTVESAFVMKDKMTRRSRGFGFVEMSSEAEANAAIEKLNGADMGGRTLVVNMARPQADRPAR